MGETAWYFFHNSQNKGHVFVDSEAKKALICRPYYIFHDVLSSQAKVIRTLYYQKGPANNLQE